MVKSQNKKEISMSHNHIRTLNEEEKQCLAQWLKEQRIILNLRGRRYFSDVLPTARIVKRAHPRLVDLHNYAAKSSIKLKLQNWEVFDTKVLKRLNISMPHALLEKLAQAEVGAIETLFLVLIPVIKGRHSPMPSPMLHNDTGSRTNRNAASLHVPNNKPLHKPPIGISRSRTMILPRKSPQVTALTGGDLQPAKVLHVDVDTLIDGKMQKAPRKMVAYEDYTEAVRASEEKDNYIKMIEQKADYLQSLIAVKEERISDLMEQMSKLSVSILDTRSAQLSDDDNNEDDAYNRININTHQSY